PLCSAHVNANSIWKTNGITVAGGNVPGTGVNELYSAHTLFLHNGQTLYIAEWKIGAACGRIRVGGNTQLKNSTDSIVDKARDNVFICDRGNKRDVRWSFRNVNDGETIIAGIGCCGVTMDEQGFLYVSDNERQEVRRWQVGKTQGIVVAGGNGVGNRDRNW
ncbi:unnamed protein product, partial [Rotaria socialis]